MAPNTILTKEEIDQLPRVQQLMAHMKKSKELQSLLTQMYSELLQDRAFQKLIWKPEDLYESAAAAGFSHGQLLFIADLCNYGIIED